MSGADAAIGTAATLLAVAVAGYLALGLLAATLDLSAGVTGRCAQAVLALYPQAARLGLRAAAAAAVGLGGAVVGAAPASAAAAGGPPHPPRPPLVAPPVPVEPLDWPVSAPPAVSTARASIVVRPGDCLWGLAARALGPRATAAAIAAQWPRWWAANRESIGDDPELLRPGLRLHAPTLSERSTS